MQEMYYSQYNMYGKGWLPPCGQHPPSQQQYLSTCMEDQQNAWSVYQQAQVPPPPPPPPTTVADIWTEEHLTNVPPPHDPPDLHQTLHRVPPARSPYEWMTKPSYQSQPNPGKTRTKDKYRVVYTDHQRLELEKEFHYSRYITIRRKAELASLLSLSERQVKIWFQNRRAKERKQMKKREEMMHKEKMHYC